MPSEDVRLFRESFFPSSWAAAKDGPEVDALLRLQGKEREEAERLLLESLSPENILAVIGLGELRSQKASLPLKSLLSKVSGEMLVEVAMAMWKIEEYPHSRDYIISVLRGKDHRSLFRETARIAFRDLHPLRILFRWVSIPFLGFVLKDRSFDRNAAAYALKQFKCKASMRALLEAVLNDEDSLVRDRAARSLFEHLFMLDATFPGDFDLLHQLVDDTTTEHWKAIKVLKEWIDQKGYL